jgi:hypothetical protein
VSLLNLLIFLVILVVVVVVLQVSQRNKARSQSYRPPQYPQQPMVPPYPPQYPPQPGQYPPQQLQYPSQQPYYPPQPAVQNPAVPNALPPGYRPQPTDQYVTAAQGYQLLLPQFGPDQKAIISIAVVAQGKVCFRATQTGTGVFGGGLDLISGRRQPHEDVLTSVRRILAEETGGWTGRPLATVGSAQWDLGAGQENEVCYAVLLDPQPNDQLPAVGMTTWAARADLAHLRDLGPRAQIACQFAGDALSAAGF